MIDTYDEKYEDGAHWSAAFREYYQDVDGCEPENGAMEIHFVDDVIPGYFWIFPAGDGLVNVGTGMLIDYMKRDKVKLRALQHKIVQNHPKFKARFANSKLIEGSGKDGNYHWDLQEVTENMNQGACQLMELCLLVMLHH